MRQVDPVHGRAEADGPVQEDDLLVGVRLGEPADEVQLGADGPLGAGLGRVQRLDDVLGGAHHVGGRDDLVLALGVHQHGHPGDARAHVVHRVDGEPAVHRAVAAPEDHLGVAQLLGGQAAVRLVRVVEHAVVQRHAHLAHGGVAAQVLVGQEEHLLALLEGPLQRALGVGGGADGAAVPAGEGLDVGGGVHVRDRDGDVGYAGVGEDVPALGDLLGGGHVGHRTAGGEVRQDDLLGRAGQDVRGLGHEVHAAEDDELGLRAGGGVAGELERVAGDVRELDHLVALVVVAEDEDALAQRGLGLAGALDEVGVGGGGEIARALDAALAGGVGLAAEQQQRERRRAGVDAVGLSGGGHGRVPSWCGRVRRSGLLVYLTLSIITRLASP